MTLVGKVCKYVEKQIFELRFRTHYYKLLAIYWMNIIKVSQGFTREKIICTRCHNFAYVTCDTNFNQSISSYQVVAWDSVKNNVEVYFELSRSRGVNKQFFGQLWCQIIANLRGKQKDHHNGGDDGEDPTWNQNEKDVSIVQDKVSRIKYSAKGRRGSPS